MFFKFYYLLIIRVVKSILLFLGCLDLIGWFGVILFGLVSCFHRFLSRFYFILFGIINLFGFIIILLGFFNLLRFIRSFGFGILSWFNVLSWFGFFFLRILCLFSLIFTRILCLFGILFLLRLPDYIPRILSWLIFSWFNFLIRFLWIISWFNFILWCLGSYGFFFLSWFDFFFLGILCWLLWFGLFFLWFLDWCGLLFLWLLSFFGIFSGSWLSFGFSLW
jgi:hypothetical protein